MKILHIGNLKGGIDTYIRSIVAFADDDFEFVIVNGPDDLCKPFLRHGKPVRQYSIDMYRKLNLWKDLKSLWLAVRIITKEKPDVVHCHSAKGGVIGRFAALLTRTHCAYTAHAFSFLSAASEKQRKLYLTLEKLTKLNAVLIGCSESERLLGLEKVGYSEKRALTWKNAIPRVTSEDVKEPEPAVLSQTYIISIARPSYQKNPFLMVEAMSRVHQKHPDVKLYLVGVGFHSPLHEETKALISKLGLDDTIIMLPWLNHSETLGYLKYAQLYLTTSVYEGLSMSVLEAMAMGKTIVSSDVIGNRECVEDGVNGLLLPMDSQKMAESVCLLLENDTLREKMGKASSELFEKKFLINHQIGELEQLYRRWAD